jgi:antirestriction protein
MEAEKSLQEKLSKGKQYAGGGKLSNGKYKYENGGKTGEFAMGGRIKVGVFNENQLRNKEDKKAVEKAQKETGLNYVDTKIIKKGGQVFLEVYLISNEEYYNSNKFGNGGSVEDSPSIYVADLEAYNNGSLNGEWLKLTDYNNADELMEAIQVLLDKWGVEEYAIHDTEYIPRNLSSEYMGKEDFEQLYEMIDLANEYNLPLEVVQDVVSQYDARAVQEYRGKYDSAIDFAEQQVDEVGLENFSSPEYYVSITDTDRRLLAGEMADGYVEGIKNEDGGNRVIEEAGLDVSEYEESDSDRQEEMIDEAVEIVREEYYDTWYDGLSDPYEFLVKEQGLYSPEDFFEANFISVDYDRLADDLEQDYTFIYDSNNDLYVFNIR